MQEPAQAEAAAQDDDGRTEESLQGQATIAEFLPPLMTRGTKDLDRQQLQDELTRKLKEQGIQIAEQRAMLLKQQQMLNALLKKIGDDSIATPNN